MTRIPPMVILTLTVTAMIAGCDRAAPPPETAAASVTVPTTTQMRPTAGVQDLMASMIDPAADYLWGSVGTINSVAGTKELKPQTDEDWKEVRRQALILAESANLLLVPGRHVAKEGQPLEGAETPGNLTAAEAEQAIAASRQTFDGFALALHEVATTMLAAAEAHDAEKLFDTGEALDQVCEDCHLKFWYPNAPPLPGSRARETK